MRKDAQNQAQPEEVPANTEEHVVAAPSDQDTPEESQAGEAPEIEPALQEETTAEVDLETTVDTVSLDEEEPEIDLEEMLADRDQEIEALKNQILRARADLENFRRRTEREKQESLRYANKHIFSCVLEVLDNFDRALLSATDPEDNFVIGVSMIHKQLTDVLTQNGVEEIDAKGRAFDPYLDEAIANEPSSEHEENMIMEVFQKGYKYHGSLLRPTKVKVATPPEPKNEPEETSEETLTEG